MMGNFSIGDYFRNEVLPWAFELLTSDKWFGMDKNKLYITYYPNDHATRDLWIKCGMSPDHLIPLEDNFWEIGEGPCGPDTEIFYDRGESYDKRGKELIEQDIEMIVLLKFGISYSHNIIQSQVFLVRSIRSFLIRILILVQVLKDYVVLCRA